MSNPNSEPFSTGSSSSFRHRANNNDSNVLCYCGISLRVQTSWTKANPGRRFMSCPNRGQPNKCGYFVWFDPQLPDRSADIIVGLAAKLKTTKEKLAQSELKCRCLLKFTIASWALTILLLLISWLLYG